MTCLALPGKCVLAASADSPAIRSANANIPTPIPARCKSERRLNGKCVSAGEYASAGECASADVCAIAGALLGSVMLLAEARGETSVYENEFVGRQQDVRQVMPTGFGGIAVRCWVAVAGIFSHLGIMLHVRERRLQFRIIRIASEGAAVKFGDQLAVEIAVGVCAVRNGMTSSHDHRDGAILNKCGVQRKQGLLGDGRRRALGRTCIGVRRVEGTHQRIHNVTIDERVDAPPRHDRVRLQFENTADATTIYGATSVAVVAENNP